MFKKHIWACPLTVLVTVGEPWRQQSHGIHVPTSSSEWVSIITTLKGWQLISVSPFTLPSVFFFALLITYLSNALRICSRNFHPTVGIQRTCSCLFTLTVDQLNRTQLFSYVYIDPVRTHGVSLVSLHEIVAEIRKIMHKTVHVFENMQCSCNVRRLSSWDNII